MKERSNRGSVLRSSQGGSVSDRAAWLLRLEGKGP